MKTRFEPSLPRMSAWKNIKIQDSKPGPLQQLYVLWHWTTKPRYIESPQICSCEDHSWGNKSAKPVKVTGKNESLVVLNVTNIDMWDHLVSPLMVQWQNTCQICRGPEFKPRVLSFFSWWHPLEPRFKSGFHNSFWDLVVHDRISWMTLEIYKWKLEMSFG